MSYTELQDQSGNGRHMVPDGGTIGVTSTAYPTATGTQVLPDVSGVGTLIASAPFTSGNLTMFGFGPHDTAQTNTNPVGIYLMAYGLYYGSCLMVRWSSDDGGVLELAITGVGDPITDSPAIPFPQSASVDAWYAYVVRRSLDGTGTISTWTWIVVGDMDDGAGIRVLGDERWSETTTPDEESAFSEALAEGSGVAMGLRHEGAGGALYGSARSDTEIALGLAWCAGRFTASAAATVADLLGV